MATSLIYFDATANGTGTVSPVTFTHTCAVGVSILILGIQIKTQGVGTIDAVTYNGVDMTVINQQSRTVGSDSIGSSLYYLINPASGGNTVSVSFTATNPRISIGTSSWFNVDRIIPIYDKQKTSGNGSPSILTCNSEPGDIIIDSIAAYRSVSGTPVLTAGGTQTQLWNNSVGPVPGVVGAGSWEEETHYDTENTSWTLSPVNDTAHCAAVLKAETPPQLAQVGVGL